VIAFCLNYDQILYDRFDHDRPKSNHDRYLQESVNMALTGCQSLTVCMLTFSAVLRLSSPLRTNVLAPLPNPTQAPPGGPRRACSFRRPYARAYCAYALTRHCLHYMHVRYVYATSTCVCLHYMYVCMYKATWYAYTTCMCVYVKVYTCVHACI